MRFKLPARQLLDDQLRRLGDEHLVVVELAAPADLVCEPDVDPTEIRARHTASRHRRSRVHAARRPAPSV
jgi:hypothetical protein